MSDSRNQPPVPSSWSDADDHLDSWKEIASYLQRTLTTVRRWEKEEGLPVRRHLHHKKASVYAYRSEIDTWRENRSGALENDRPGWFRFFSENKKTVVGVAGGVTLLLLVGLVVWIGSPSNPEGANPDSFERNMWAAGEFIHADHNLLRARKHLDRARDLLTDDIIRRSRSSFVKLMLFSAQEAWLLGDPETALAEIGKVSQKLESLEISGYALLPLASLYYALGKVQLAHELFTDSLDKKSLINGLHQLAFYYEATKPNLQQYLGISEGSIPYLSVAGGSILAAIVLARAGFTEEAEAVITEFERDPNKYPKQRHGVRMARGVLSLSKGNTKEGIQLIEDGLGQARGGYFLGSLSLAETWREQDQLEAAVRVLEHASSKQALLFAPFGGQNPVLWLRIRLMLAKTYREMGRDEDARKVEAELRTLLAYADADHPILLQLGSTGDVALLQTQK